MTKCGELLQARRDNEIEMVITPNGEDATAYKVCNRAHFVRLMRESMLELGLVAEEEEFSSVDQDNSSDFRSEACLREIFDVNKRSWVGRIQYEQGMQNQAILYRFPAWRFGRNAGIEHVPARFQYLDGLVVLKTDEGFWNSLGDDPLLDLSRPWDSDGFSKYFHLRDVNREEAAALGLKVESIKPDTTKNLNSNLSSSVKKMDPELKKKLVKELRPEIRKSAKFYEDRAKERRNKRLMDLKEERDRFFLDQ